MRAIPRFTSMTVGMAVGVTAAVAAACAIGAYVYSLHHFETLLNTARSSALAEGDLIRVALEHQMMENDRSLIARMIESFGRQQQVRKVVLLDRRGVERYSSAPGESGTQLSIDSPTCQACHRLPPEDRESSRVIEVEDGALLRTVIPFRNREACHRCHNPSNRVNGILILDYDAAGIRTAMNRDLGWLVAGSGALTLLLVGAIALVFRVVVMRRLQRFESTARQFVAGDLTRRVPALGSDAISWLAREFNAMADSVTGLLNEVGDQRGRLETIINSIDDGIAVLDARRTLVAANDAFLRRTGLARGQAVGCFCGDVARGMCGETECPTLACLQTGERQVRIFERRVEGGAGVAEEVHTSPIRDASGKIVHVVEVWRDISGRRAAEARLAESHRLASLGVLASGFSHELNTPLATVLTCVEAILRDARIGGNGAPDVGRIGDNATIARDQVLRCRGITQHFLRMSRGQSSPGDIVELGPAVAAVVRLIEPTARAQSVTVEVAPIAPGARVRADEAELQHGLVNLLLNAIQACRPGGKIAVQTHAGGPGEPFRVRITDDGCGIAPEHRARIFEPFFSLRKGGTGLGLFLALNFVRRWGGDITVESAPGVGSTFEIRLPALTSADE